MVVVLGGVQPPPSTIRLATLRPAGSVVRLQFAFARKGRASKDFASTAVRRESFALSLARRVWLGRLPPGQSGPGFRTLLAVSKGGSNWQGSMSRESSREALAATQRSITTAPRVPAHAIRDPRQSLSVYPRAVYPRSVMLADRWCSVACGEADTTVSWWRSLRNVPTDTGRSTSHDPTAATGKRVGGARGSHALTDGFELGEPFDAA